MNLFLPWVGLTVLSHFLLATFAPGWLKTHPNLAILEWVIWGGWLVYYPQLKRSRLHQQNRNVVDLNLYRKTKQSQTKPAPWVCVYRSGDPAEIGLLNSLFEANQIQFKVAGRHSSSLLPNIGAMPMELWVTSEHLDRARKLLEDFSTLPPN